MAGTALRNLPANDEKALRSMRENCISREKRYKEELQRLTKNHTYIPHTRVTGAYTGQKVNCNGAK